MINAPMLLDAWLWLAIIAKWWLIASVCLLFFLVITRRADKPARRRRPPPNHPGFSGGLHSPG
jgi:hypothetical protein